MPRHRARLGSGSTIAPRLDRFLTAQFKPWKDEMTKKRKRSPAVETRAKKGAKPTPESSESTKPPTPNKGGFQGLVDVTDRYLGRSIVFVGTPHKKFSKKVPKNFDPWTTVSAEDLRAHIDLRLAENKLPPDSEAYLSIKSALVDVFDAQELQERARQIFNGECDDPPEGLSSISIEERLCPFLEGGPEWVVRCSVTDSMVSGVWGLKSFTIGGRGYLYYMPDLGSGDDRDDLPILSAWEPIEDDEAFRACFVDTYTKTWRCCGLPPFMGQWAKGPCRFMLDAVWAVLQQTPTAWSRVLEKLDELYWRIEKGKEQFEDVVKETAECTAVSRLIVSEILRSRWENRATVMNSQNLTDRESHVLVAAFLIQISRRGF